MDAGRLSADGRRWAVATPHTVATDAGVAAFESGGNAIDAALAAATTLAVVYPQACGVGGDLFALVRRGGGDVRAVNSSGAAPAAADVEALRARGNGMPEFGPATITVPGAVAGWWAIAELGARRAWRDALAPAIAIARDGSPLARATARALESFAGRLARDPGMAAVFYPTGEPLREGEGLQQPALAQTLEAIATDGSDALYRGDVGRRLTAGLSALGSRISRDDLRGHEVDLSDPLVGRYRDVELLTAPPNSQGFLLLEMLAAIERLGATPDALGADAATIAEVFRIASADRDRHLADPRRVRVPVDELLGGENLDRICREARAGAPTAAPARIPTGGDTIGLVAADAEGYAVSLIQSLWSGFGSGLLEPSTGIVAHNRGALFSLDTNSPNAIEPGKRPLHTLVPVMVRDGRDLVAVGGSMGGGGQPQIHAQILMRLLDRSVGPSDAVAAPRWLAGSIGDPSRRVVVEARVPEFTVAALLAAGYRVNRLADYDDAVGQAHLIRVEPGGGFSVGSDPRADGSAAAG